MVAVRSQDSISGHIADTDSFDDVELAPRIAWNALQTKFLAETVADVLLIMGCCSAVSAVRAVHCVRSSQSGAAALWAACAPDLTTPVAGEHCFTHN